MKKNHFKLELREHITKTLEHHRSEYGPPTVICTHTKFIAMGMKNGAIFLFDIYEQLQAELSPNPSNMGCVTAIDFNYNGSHLIVGYQSGQLILWDVINKKELKKIKDAHSSSIIFVKFYRRGTLRIASCDCKGIMFTWSFSKIFFSYQVDRNTLFNGRKAGILYDISLFKPNINYKHILDQVSLCAVANNESVFFVTLEPAMTLKQTIVLANTSIDDLKRGALPILAWRISYSQPKSPQQSRKPSPSPPPPSSLPPPTPNSNRTFEQKQDVFTHFHTYNPVLAVGSGTVIQLIEVFIRDEKAFIQHRDTGLIRMRGIGQIQLDKLVIAMKWLNEENLIILTANDEIYICSGWPIKISERIWPIPKSPKQSYGNLISPLTTSSMIKPNATIKKKISMDFFIRHQYFGKNIICFKNCLEIIDGLDRTGQTNKLMILTNTNMVSAYCMTWYDRIDKLIREGEWIKACCLIIDFFILFETNKISSQSSSVRKLLAKIDSYILQFCEFVVQSNKISDDELESFGGVAMDYCVNLKRTGTLLFDKVYKILLNNGGREIFFKLLEPYILNDKINTLPPEFMQNFADFMVSKYKINELEQIILHLSPQSFDIHQIVSICRQHKLFIALCYLYNQACLDYSEPINDMFYKIMNENENNNNSNDDWIPLKNHELLIQRGYQLILYLKYTMNGMTFPWCNKLPTPLRAKQQILHTLFNTRKQYQILRHLLALDIKEILFNIIKVAFEDKHLFRNSSSSTNSSSPGASQRRSTSSNNRSFENDISETMPTHKRRTSMQIKGMLSSAQSAVTTGAKWALSAAALTPRPGRPVDDSRQLPTLDVIEADNFHNPDTLDPNIILKSKQEMLNILVKIIIDEDNSATKDELKSVKKSEREIFYEFCTPLLASGECEVNIKLLKCVLDYLFSESVRLLNRIEKLNKQYQYQKQQVVNDRNGNINIKMTQSLSRMERELETLIFTQNNFENTILILLSRKMETNNKDFDVKSLLEQAQQSKFHKVELYLHRESGNHAAVIDSYLADKDLEVQVFDYINNLFYDIKQEFDLLNQNANSDHSVVTPHYNNRYANNSNNTQKMSNSKFINVIQIVVKRIARLVIINSEQCGELIFKWFPQYFDNTVGALQNNRKMQYVFLQQIVKSLHSLQLKKLTITNKH